MLTNIPAELKRLPQWVVANANKIPFSPTTRRTADVTDPSTWGTFEEAVNAGFQYVGFVLASWDEYSIIDLDNKPDHPVTEQQWNRHVKILNAFESYTELSASGTGYHIIVKGKIPSGVHRDNTEVYSSGRYMICTGNVVRNAPIVNHQPLLDVLYGEMRPPPVVDLNEIEGNQSDSEILEMAANAANGEKFNTLCCGDMTGYPSQSEADFALLSILAFYTKDNEQVRRIFRMSALGKREKAVRNDTYLNFALGKIRAAQPAPVDLTQLIANATALQPAQPEPPPPPPPVEEPPLPTPDPMAWPPGLIGELAHYFYHTSIRPVPEVALAAAIAFTAGLSGRSYNISGVGLNQYIILLAKTGVGKEGAQSGIDRMITAVRTTIPMIDQFTGPGAFASGQALVKFLADRPVFLSILGEFGITLQQVSDPRSNSALTMLKKVLLDLYSKSGWHQTMRSSVYSDTEKNVKAVQAPSVTLLGESTPEAFFDGLDASHIAEGLIPRFSIIEYVGERPERNRNAGAPPPPDLVKKVADLVTVALTTSNNGQCCHVVMDDLSTSLMDDFDDHAGHQMRGKQSEVEVQLWNRAHLKALKLAALLAVGVSPHQPVVTADLAKWAISFVRRDVESVLARFRKGDVGQGDHKQLQDLRKAIESYFQSPTPRVKEAYGNFWKDKIIPYACIQSRVVAVSSFRRDRNGATAAIKRGLQTLVDTGALVEVARPTLVEKYSFSGVAYGIGRNWE